MDKELRDLLLLSGISGYENDIRNYIKEYSKKLKNYQIEYDNLGSIFLVKKSSEADAKTILVAGHMDEVGLMVVEISETGLLKLNPIGGLVRETLTSQVLNVFTDNGVISGVVPSIPTHLSSLYQSSSEIYLDIGAKSKEEAINAGVRLGNMVTFRPEIISTINKSRFISKAIDNRFGCALALIAAKKFDQIDLPYNLIIGATVLEEVGLRGASTATKKFKPDCFIALDSSPVNDSLDNNSMAKLGEGFLIRMIDPRNIMLKGLYEYFITLAKKKKIKHQHYVAKGGTDAAEALVSNDGVLATTIGLPARYIHSNAALFDIRDIEEAKKMLFALLKSLDNKVIEKIKNVNQ
ncbi:hypothetical protein LJC17_00975 [Acholeplasma sp. OttesenSCG-928-E16]|nr:hypothetical protein [Acholeplasma sp. OttesenSCG-928-E16]